MELISAARPGGEEGQGRKAAGRSRGSQGGHPDSPPPAQGESECPLAGSCWADARAPRPRPRASPPAQTADHCCSGPARRTCTSFLCSRGGGRPSLKRRCFLKDPRLSREASFPRRFCSPGKTGPSGVNLGQGSSPTGVYQALNPSVSWQTAETRCLPNPSDS